MEDYAEEMASVDSDENTSYYFDNVDECEEILDEEGYDLVAWARSGMSIAEMAAEAGRLGDKYTCIRELKKEREDIIKYYVLRYAEMYEYTVDEDALDDIGVYYDLEEIREMTMWKKEALKHEEVRN